MRVTITIHGRGTMEMFREDSGMTKHTAESRRKQE